MEDDGRVSGSPSGDIGEPPRQGKGYDAHRAELHASALNGLAQRTGLAEVLVQMFRYVDEYDIPERLVLQALRDAVDGELPF